MNITEVITSHYVTMIQAPHMFNVPGVKKLYCVKLFYSWACFYLLFKVIYVYVSA